MGKSTYYYNPETCQYERARLKLWEVIAYSAGVVITGVFIFAGIQVAADTLFESAEEKALREENAVLGKHHEIVAVQIAELEGMIDELKVNDRLIHEKLFEDKLPADQSYSGNESKKKILTASAVDFNGLLKIAAASAEKMLNGATAVNNAFADHFNIKKNDAIALQSVPTLQPVANPDLSLIVSGFGTRINPFHKGKYKHLGVDFAAPRGSEVIATAPGTVVEVDKSTLQAGYGNLIEIDHGNGFKTRYAHLETIGVRQGQRVSKGMIIGTVGSSGGSIAPHLHYEVLKDGENVDPAVYMIEGLTSRQFSQMINTTQKQNQSLD